MRRGQSVLWLGVLALGAWLPVAVAQEVGLLACTDVSIFGPGCAVEALPVVVPVVAEPSVPDFPLFPPETLARDTPPIFVQFLNDMTPENADAFLEWQGRRLHRMEEGTAMLKQRAQVRRGK